MWIRTITSNNASEKRLLSIPDARMAAGAKVVT